MKGIIYYSSGRGRPEILSGVLKQIEKSGLPITKNTTVVGKIGALSMFHQILDCLERSTEKYVFFCEHDVLYHTSHFDFTPPTDDTFYYNTNVWRWDYYSDRVITYDKLASLSGLCVNRELALAFYKNRIELVYRNEYDKIPSFGNPPWARQLGYEPGKNKRGERAITGEWRSEYSNIDIRHTRSLTPQKMYLNEFVHKPTGWKEDSINTIPGWDNIKQIVT